MTNFQRWPLALFILGAILRLLWLGDIPGGLNQDEASIGYDAWALLHSGVDRNGMAWPVNFIAWGSGQNVLYGYLSMPFIALFDLSVFSIRFTSAFWGIFSLWIFWRLGKRQDEKMAVWALLILATSPWHIMASRWALESNIVPAVVLVAVYLLARSPENIARRLPFATAVLTLSVYAYGPAYLFAPFFLLCALVLIHKQTAISLRTFMISALSALIVALPMMLFIANNAVGTGHIHLGPITIPHYPGEARYSNIFLPFAQGGLARMPDNMIVVVQLLFGGQDDGLPWNAIPFWGPQFLFLTPFVVIGAILSLKPQASLTDRLMLAWLICALFTAFCTEANINRINLVWLPSLWLASRGLWLLSHQRLISLGAQIFILVCGLLFSIQYFTSWSKQISTNFFEGFGDAIKYITKVAPPEAPIAITGNANMPYISVLFFTKTPVENYIKTAVIPDRTAPFQGVESFDRFTIGLSPTFTPQQSYWVAHISELASFNLLDYNIKTFGDYAAVTRKTIQEKTCLQPLEISGFTGEQDYDKLAINKEVGSNRIGLPIAGQQFAQGFGIHGDSQWSLELKAPTEQLEIGMGLSSSSGCSDGQRFKILLDDKLAFDSKVMRPGQLKFTSVSLHNAKKISFVTEAGASNRCDHGLWITPVIKRYP